MSNWQSDKLWSDRFIPEMRRIIGPLLLVPSSLEVDQKQAADLVVLKAEPLTIACRVRRPGFMNGEHNYRDQFTIRCRRDSGATTELEKILEGWADWMFYGHSDIREQAFDLWWLLDLDVFREDVKDDAGCIRGGEKSNRDGTFFHWFDITSFPQTEPPLVISCSEAEWRNA